MILREQWEEILADNELDELDLRDNRYHQVCMAMHGNDKGLNYYQLWNSALLKTIKIYY